MAKRRRGRNWRNDEKRMICAQSRFPGASVSQVARRYDVNANQVFNWLKDPQFATRAGVVHLIIQPIACSAFFAAQRRFIASEIRCQNIAASVEKINRHI